MDFHYVSDNKALKPMYFRNHLINSSITMVLSSRSNWCSPVWDEISNSGLNCTMVSLHPLFVTYRFVFQVYLGMYVCTVLFCVRALHVFIYLIDVCIFSLNNVLILLCVIFLTYMCCPWLCSHGGWLLLKCSAIGIGFNGAKTNCGIAHILGILLRNSYDT